MIIALFIQVACAVFFGVSMSDDACSNISMATTKRKTYFVCNFRMLTENFLIFCCVF